MLKAIRFAVAANFGLYELGKLNGRTNVPCWMTEACECMLRDHSADPQLRIVRIVRLNPHTRCPRIHATTALIGATLNLQTLRVKLSHHVLRDPHRRHLRYPQPRPSRSAPRATRLRAHHPRRRYLQPRR